MEPSVGAAARPEGLPFAALESEDDRSGAFREMRLRLRRCQRQLLVALHLLSCNALMFFTESLSRRNLLVAGMNAVVFESAWLCLEPSLTAFSFGLACLLSAAPRVGVLGDPLPLAGPALLLQGAFGASSGPARLLLWHLVGVLVVASEVCWWPSLQYLAEEDFHAWLVLFSTYYLMATDFWFWPQLLRIDPEHWGVAKVIEQAPPETRQAIEDTGAGLAVVVLLPLVACGAAASLIVWRESPRLCVLLTVGYVGAMGLLLLFRDATPRQVANAGQIPIAAVFIFMAREQLGPAYGDLLTWKVQVALVAVFLAIRWLVAAFSPHGWDDEALVTKIGILLFHLGCKQWLAGACRAARASALGRASPHPWQLAWWAPSRSGLLFGRDEAHDEGVALHRW